VHDRSVITASFVSRARNPTNPEYRRTRRDSKRRGIRLVTFRNAAVCGRTSDNRRVHGRYAFSNRAFVYDRGRGASNTAVVWRAEHANRRIEFANDRARTHELAAVTG